jgi:hypothetical protein
MTSVYLKELIGAYVCFFIIGAFELVVLIKIFSGKHSVQTRNILLLLVISLVFAVGSAQLMFQIDPNSQTPPTTLVAVLTSICIFFYSTSSSLAFWIYSCHYQRVTDTFYSVRHAGAKGCFTRLRFAEIVVAIGVVILELSIAASKYFVQKHGGTDGVR